MTSVRKYLRSLGTELSPTMIQATQRFFMERLANLDPRPLISRDHAYGPDPRHRLDIFSKSPPRPAPLPVLVFVHGGAFVMGDKRLPGTPFYDNVGTFAVHSGYIGVTITYRLAPAHPWPAGAEDVAAVVRWLHANIEKHGGDPEQIFLLGQSAGAVHVAGYVADPSLHVVPGGGIAGALMVSGSYDATQTDSLNAQLWHNAYYGEDPERWGERSTFKGLVASPLPLFFSVSEFDAAHFHKQAALLTNAYVQDRGRFPQIHWLAGHNHLSPILAIGTPADTLGPKIQQFIARIDVEE